MPAELKSSSGMFDRKIAATATVLTAPPAIIKFGVLPKIYIIVIK